MKKLINRQNITFLVVMAFMLIVPLFCNNYYLKIFQLIAIYQVFAMSLNLLMGIGGTVSFGHGAFFGVGAYTSACLFMHFGWPSWAAFPFVIILSGLAGLFLAVPMSRITGRYVTIITLSYAEILNLIMKNWTSVTNGVMGILNIPNINLFGFELKTKLQFYYFAMIMVVITFIFMKWIVNSKLGRNLKAMRDDPIAAEAMGINLFKNKIVVFTISAIFAGIAGTLYAHSYHYIDSICFDSDSSFKALSIVVVGGLGNFTGTLIGSIFIVALPELLRNVDFLFNYRLIVYGVVLVLTMWLNHSIPGDKLKKKVSALFKRKKPQISTEEKEVA